MASAQALTVNNWIFDWTGYSEREIEAQLAVDHKTIHNWLFGEKSATAENSPPASRQHFDVWDFPTCDNEAGGDKSYFGRMAPQIVENLLWLFTEPIPGTGLPTATVDGQ